MSYLGSLVQFSPATGRAGRCRQTSLYVGSTHPDIAVCGEHSPCSSHTGFAPHRGVCAFPVYPAQAPGCSIWSGPCVECGSSFRVLHKSTDSVAPAFCAFPGLSSSGSQRLGRPLTECDEPFHFVVSGPGSQRLGRPLPRGGAPFPSAASGPGSRGLGRSHPGGGTPFPSAAPARAAGWVPAAWFVHRSWPQPRPSQRRVSTIQNLRKSSDRNRVLFAGWEGVASLGLSLPLSPTPASYLHRGWAGSSLEFLSPFVS